MARSASLREESLDGKILKKKRVGKTTMKEKEKLENTEKAVFKFNKKGKLRVKFKF